MTIKKLYIHSGQLNVVLLAEHPLEAIQQAVMQFGNGKKLDPEYFYVDERGFRGADEAKTKIHIDRVRRSFQ